MCWKIIVKLSDLRGKCSEISLLGRKSKGRRQDNLLGVLHVVE
jgi:hypothetical protein